MEGKQNLGGAGVLFLNVIFSDEQGAPQPLLPLFFDRKNSGTKTHGLLRLSRAFD